MATLIAWAALRWPRFDRYVMWHCERVWLCRAVWLVGAVSIGTGLAVLIWLATGLALLPVRVLMRVVG